MVISDDHLPIATRKLTFQIVLLPYIFDKDMRKKRIRQKYRRLQQLQHRDI